MRANIIILLFLSIFNLTALAQFKTKTEIDYLKLIHGQQNKVLIKDNLKNLKFVANRLIVAENDTYSAYFFNELSRSYQICQQKELSFFYLFVQRCLFPKDSLSAQHKNNFFELAYSLKLGSDNTQTYWNKTLTSSIPQKYTERIILLLELATELHFEKLTSPIYDIGLTLRSKDQALPAWYQHWEFLTIIGFSENQKKKIIHPDNYEYQEIYSQIEGKNKSKIYRKAIKHYIKVDAKSHAKELINNYRTGDLSIAEKVDLFVKKIKINL